MKKYIKNIKKGDKVKVFNTKTGKFGKSEVINTFQGKSDHYYIVNDSIKVTGEHPFYVEDSLRPKGFRWTRVKELKVGDMLMDKEGNLSPLESLERVDEGIDIYNLTVKGEHNYFAGGFLVHNKGYKGNNKYAKARAPEIRQPQINFNESTSIEWSSALDKMYVMGKDTSDTLGAAQELNAAGEIEKPATGDYKTLLDKLDESRNTLQSDMKGVQETQEENQDAVRDAMQASNMVTATERMEMDAQNVVAEAAEEAREAKDQSVEQAKRDFDAAVEEKTSELSTNMGAELNTALAESKEKTEALEKGFDNLKKYKANFTKNFAAWVRPSGGWGDKISKKPTYNDITHSSAEEVPKSMNINPAEGHAVYKKSSGTLTNPDNISSALTILGDLNKTTSVNPDEMVGDKPVSKYMADAINQHPEKKWAAVQEVWAAGGATTPGNDGNNKVIRCFAGNTWIEVVK